MFIPETVALQKLKDLSVEKDIVLAEGNCITDYYGLKPFVYSDAKTTART